MMEHDEESEIDIDKLRIIELFIRNVKGVNICISDYNVKHCGKEGYWLEERMGIRHTSKNEPDIYGYEMKKTSAKTTLGDYSASEYAFSSHGKRTVINAMNKWTDIANKLTRSVFIKTFGNANCKKNDRYAWSGSCIPSYNKWNANGQILKINATNDIIIYYSYLRDTRELLKSKLPLFLRSDDDDGIVIAFWKSDKMRHHINNKFNKRGFFMCKKTAVHYTTICFGKPFNYDYFIECLKKGTIIFDSGMYEGNSRTYSQFRGVPAFWNELITEEY
jgi:hypothetical protein